METEQEHVDILLSSELGIFPKTSVEMEVEVSSVNFMINEDSNFSKSKAETDPIVSEVVGSSESPPEKNPGKPPVKSNVKEISRYRPLHLPLARVKQIIKMDPDVQLASSDAVFLIAKAAELFIELLSKDAHAFTVSSKKKTIQKKDVDSAIANTDALIFLDGALDF